MSSTNSISDAERLMALFCAHCAFLEQRRGGICPKGQATCGAQIGALYTLNRAYAGLATGSPVTIKDIFWSVNKDYATVTIVSEQGQRYGVACTLLDERIEPIG